MYMGGKDFCCSVAGTPHIWNVDELIQQLLYRIPNDAKRNRTTSFQFRGKTFKSGGHAISPTVVQGLRFSPEDMEASRDCVLIAGYAPVEGAGSEEEETIGELYCQMDHEPDVDDTTHAVALFNIVPQDEGEYVERGAPDNWYNVWWDSGAYPITFTAYCILKTVAPELEASAIYRTFTYRSDPDLPDHETRHVFLGTPKEIDYGIVEKISDQYVDRPEICEDNDTDGFWTYLLCYSDLSDEEILNVAWNGEGNLWVFVRPDRRVSSSGILIGDSPTYVKHLHRFPIRSALAAPPLTHFQKPSESKSTEDEQARPRFDSLPIDILFLICEDLPLKPLLHVLSLNHRLRSHLLPHSNELAYKAMKNNDPCYFPALPIKTPDGTRQREELDWWEKEWLEAGEIAESDIRQKAPWLRYWMECSRTGSMRNRKRIWRTAESIKALALENGFI
ncbi:hypothetical protein NMY22_g4114 [Coprinellus aureogranulatus]|nr:hypothetical protein NMY22_g4114 [Coprinellus aureogranulatus]